MRGAQGANLSLSCKALILWDAILLSKEILNFWNFGAVLERCKTRARAMPKPAGEKESAAVELRRDRTIELESTRTHQYDDEIAQNTRQALHSLCIMFS